MAQIRYYQTGDTRDRVLWHDYSRITRGLAAVRWSRGLRAAMLASVAVPEQTDEELAAEDVNGELVAVIAVEVWSRSGLLGWTTPYSAPPSMAAWPLLSAPRPRDHRALGRRRLPPPPYFSYLPYFDVVAK